MSFKPSITALLLATLLLCGARAHAQQNPADKGKDKDKGVPAVAEPGEAEEAEEAQDAEEAEEPHGAQEAPATSEAAVPAAPDVNVTVASTDGRITVRGTDSKEVRARATTDGAKLRLRVVGEAENAPNSPAARVELQISEKEEMEGEACLGEFDVELEVPRGATVYLKTQDGDITVQDVTEAHLETNDGRIEAMRIAKSVDAASLGGNVTLEDATGRAHLTSLNGIVEVRGVRPLDGSDFLKVKTVSGDILLDGIGPARVEANTISGELRLTGPLARGGTYDFNTTTGDVTILMPADSSFKVNAKVSEHGEIITEFPLQYRGAASPASPPQPGRLLGTHGSGDATITLVSFSGTLRLRKQ
ncbi:MAG TPA: DUF4097 family beta strand repeat-containing protein [Pyrinomonadaceae bacterium]|nr:DUF4097 family beta strand repeat-containing protein [Pyrinomonadaceae bacterium]